MCYNYIANCKIIIYITLSHNTTQFSQGFAFNQEKNYILENAVNVLRARKMLFIKEV